MNQENGIGSSRASKTSRSSIPGIAPALGILLISAVVAWFWLASGRANPLKPGMTGVSVLAEVQERELAGALTTMVSNAALSQFQRGKNGECRRPLAWVTLALPPGQPIGHIRLISGNYFSPVFDVTEKPIRVAIPFPAPYESGQGVLAAIDAGGASTISLLPSWRVSAQDGKTTRPVIWTPSKGCGGDG